MSWRRDRFRLGIFPRLPERLCSQEPDRSIAMSIWVGVRYRLPGSSKWKSQSKSSHNCSEHWEATKGMPPIHSGSQNGNPVRFVLFTLLLVYLGGSPSRL